MLDAIQSGAVAANPDQAGHPEQHRVLRTGDSSAEQPAGATACTNCYRTHEAAPAGPLQCCPHSGTDAGKKDEKHTHTHTTTSAGQRLANGCTQQLRWQRRGRKQGVAVVPTMSKKCGPQKLLVSPTAHGARIDAPLLLLLLPPTHAVLAVADMSSADDSIKGGAEGQQAEGEAAK